MVIVVAVLVRIIVNVIVLVPVRVVPVSHVGMCIAVGIRVVRVPV
jgi:hypothetical protein